MTLGLLYEKTKQQQTTKLTKKQTFHLNIKYVFREPVLCFLSCRGSSGAAAKPDRVKLSGHNTKPQLPLNKSKQDSFSDTLRKAEGKALQRQVWETENPFLVRCEQVLQATIKKKTTQRKSKS